MEMKEEFRQLLHELAVDIPSTLARLNNNAMLFEQVILKFIEDQKIRELGQAIQEWKTEIAEQIAHTMKGVSGNLGMDGLSGYCNELVQSIRAGKREVAEAKYLLLENEYQRIVNLIQSYVA